MRVAFWKRETRDAFLYYSVLGRGSDSVVLRRAADGKAAHALHAAGQSSRNSVYMKALLCLLVLSAADALAAAAEATAAKGKLLVCVQEARGLLDLDAQESVGTQGSDTFVAVFLGGTMIGSIGIKPGAARQPCRHRRAC